MADHLEFLRSVPGPAPALGPTPPLDPQPAGVPHKRQSPDPIRAQRAGLRRRLEDIHRERAQVLERLKLEHQHFIELEACAGAVVGALTELERYRFAHFEESSDDA